MRDLVITTSYDDVMCTPAGGKNCLRIHVRDDFDFSEPLNAARLARKAMSLETRDDRLKMITEDERRV